MRAGPKRAIYGPNEPPPGVPGRLRRAGDGRPARGGGRRGLRPERGDGLPRGEAGPEGDADKTPLSWHPGDVLTAPWQVTMQAERFGGGIIQGDEPRLGPQQDSTTEATVQIVP